MKTTFRVPLNEPYAYIEMESDEESFEGALTKHQDMMSLIKGGAGLPDKDFDEFIQNIIEEKPSHIETLEKLSEEQRKYMKVVDRAMNRINYKLRKETASQDDHIKSIN